MAIIRLDGTFLISFIIFSHSFILPYISAKIETVRGTYTEELHKVKKNQGTGSAADDVYIPKWKFFNQCQFFGMVVVAESNTVSNMPTLPQSPAPSEVSQGSAEDTECSLDDRDVSILKASKSPEGSGIQRKRKRSTPHWMGSAAAALENLASIAQAMEDEWEELASTIRNLEPKSLQRRAKFAVQQTLFTVSEGGTGVMPQVPMYQQFQPPFSMHFYASQIQC